MPRYSPIRFMEDDVLRVRTIDRLVALRAKLAEEVRAHRKTGSLLLATWNIREFGRNAKYGARTDEALHYIAEIISSFHLVALQEVNRDLTDLRKLMRFLGDDWDYILTDVTEGVGGAGERMAFLFDKRFVQFRNVAGEIVLPAGKRIGVGGDEDALQFARTPFMVAFQAGWLKFNLCTVHIYFGDDYGEKLQRRISEIETLAEFFRDRQEKEGENYILLGDFNIVRPEHETMQALEKHGFTAPENLRKEKTNLKGDKHYDQIVLKPARRIIEIGASGIFDFDETVFRPEDKDVYVPQIEKAKGRSGAALTRTYNTWRTFQMSDHVPMWAELKVDFTEEYLESLKPRRRVLAK